MKIEKISDNQIRCTLNRADLLSREIKISELAYGTEKAKTLFHDMIEQASHQFGFEAEEVPLMIEAIPVSPDCIVLRITKVEDPEELDTRFSKFAPPSEEEQEGEDEDMSDIDGYFEPFDINSIAEASMEADSSEAAFIPMAETVPNLSQKEEEPKAKEENFTETTRLFSFKSWDVASRAAVEIGDSFEGKSILYRNTDTGLFYLYLIGVADKDTGFFYASNICSEFGVKERISAGTAGFLEEHCEVIIASNAIDILCKY